jgi:hypothetical protein
MPLARHIAYRPRPEYEQLGSTGLRRYPVCVREVPSAGVTILSSTPLDPELLAFLHSATPKKIRLLLYYFSVN